MEGFRWLFLGDCSTLLFLGLVPLLVYSSPWQVSHSVGIPNILGSSAQPGLHFHSSLRGPLLGHAETSLAHAVLGESQLQRKSLPFLYSCVLHNYPARNSWRWQILLPSLVGITSAWALILYSFVEQTFLHFGAEDSLGLSSLQVGSLTKCIPALRALLPLFNFSLRLSLNFLSFWVQDLTSTLNFLMLFLFQLYILAYIAV